MLALLIAFIVIFTMPVQALAQEIYMPEIGLFSHMVANHGDCGENLTWTLDNSGVLSISGAGSMEDYTKPEDVPWYSCLNQIKIVQIKNGATRIGRYAFYNCRNLTDISIPDSVTHIEPYAFINCSQLEKLTIPSSVISVGSGSILKGTKITSAGPIGSGCDLEFGWTEHIPDYAFYLAPLISAIIPDGVTKLSASMFSGCEELTNVVMPQSVVEIGSAAFDSCSALTDISFIPEGVSSIAPYAFRDCDGLTNLTIPDHITEIRYDAFSGCDGLSVVEIPESVTKIGLSAFASCKNLKSIHVAVDNPAYSSADGVLFSKDRRSLFQYPPKREGNAYRLPEGVIEIGTTAFSDCVQLKTIALPESLRKINDLAFRECVNLEKMDIPASTDFIGWGAFSAFSGCVNLKDITVDARNLQYSSEEGVLFSKDLHRLYTYPAASERRVYHIPQSVTSVEEYAFHHCLNLEEIFVPDTLTSVYDTCFSECAHLTDIYYAGTEETWNQILRNFSNRDILKMVTIHYEWLPGENFLVSFDLNGKKESLASIRVTKGQPYGQLPAPSWEGYLFLGWYTESGAGSLVSSSTIFEGDENQTLYAHWSKERAALSVSRNDAKTSESHFVFDVRLSGGKIAGWVFAASFAESGQMIDVNDYPAEASLEASLSKAAGADYVKFMWLDEHFAPVCESQRERLTLEPSEESEIYAKVLDDAHITEGEITYQGETVTARYVDNELILQAKEGVSKARIEQLAASCHASVVGHIGILRQYQLEASLSDGTLHELIQKLKASEFVEDVYWNTVSEMEDTSTLMPPLYPDDDWGGTNAVDGLWNEGKPYGNNWGLEAIYAPSAWRLLLNHYESADDVPRMTVGIIDSMFDLEHDDLQFKEVWGYVKSPHATPHTIRVRELASNANNSDEYTHYCHGTHVAGIIGALWNEKGVNGIALKNRSRLYGVSVTRPDDSMKSYMDMFNLESALAQLMQSSVDEGSTLNRKIVINYSQKSDHKSRDVDYLTDVLKELLKTYDFLIVASAGNTKDEDAAQTSAFCAIEDPDVKAHILVVGASELGEGSGFQLVDAYNYGARIDLTAPGSAVYSTVPPNNNTTWGSAGKEYMSRDGTSMAAPHVTGVAALVWVANPELPATEVKKIICETADIQINNPDSRTPHSNMLNAAHAVAKALDMEYVIGSPCGDNLYWTFTPESKTLTFSGTGEMSEYDTNTFPWYRYQNQIESVVVNDGVTSICPRAFDTYQHIKKVSWGNTLQKIGAFSFAFLNSWEGKISFPESLQSIGAGAFWETPVKRVYFSGDAPEVTKNLFLEENEYDVSSLPSFYCKANESEVTLYYKTGTKGWSLDSDGLWNGYPLRKYSSYAISGAVQDADTGLPLPDAYVGAINQNDNGQDFYARTDDKGNFSIPLETTGIYNLFISKDGYSDVKRLGVSVSGEISVGTISMTSLESIRRNGEKLYQKVLDMYYVSILDEWENCDDEGSDNVEDPDSASWMIYYDGAPSLSDFGYSFIDMDENGVPELLIGCPDNDGLIYNLYSIVNGEIVMLASAGRHEFYSMAEDDIVNPLENLMGM